MEGGGEKQGGNTHRSHLGEYTLPHLFSALVPFGLPSQSGFEWVGLLEW